VIKVIREPKRIYIKLTIPSLPTSLPHQKQISHARFLGVEPFHSIPWPQKVHLLLIQSHKPQPGHVCVHPPPIQAHSGAVFTAVPIPAGPPRPGKWYVFRLVDGNWLWLQRQIHSRHFSSKWSSPPAMISRGGGISSPSLAGFAWSITIEMGLQFPDHRLLY
jgi:hypothetical protein